MDGKWEIGNVSFLQPRCFQLRLPLHGYPYTTSISECPWMAKLPLPRRADPEFLKQRIGACSAATSGLGPSVSCNLPCCSPRTISAFLLFFFFVLRIWKQGNEHAFSEATRASNPGPVCTFSVRFCLQ